MNTKIKNKSIGKKILKFFKYLIIFIILLFVGTYIALRSDYVKNKIGLEAISRVNEAYGTDIHAGNVYIDWQNNVVIENVYAIDAHSLEFIKIKNLKADIDIINFIEYLYSVDWKFKNLEFDKITAYSAQLQIVTYKGEKESNLIDFINKFKSDKPPSEEKFSFYSKIEFINSSVSVINENNEPSEVVDAKNLNFLIEDFNSYGSEIDASIAHLSGTIDRNNNTLEVQDFTTDFSLRPDSLQLKNLSLKSDKSLLESNLKLSYDSLASFKNFEYAVDIEGEINQGSYIEGAFINFLTPKWNTQVRYNISSTVQGTLSNLHLTALRMHSGDLKISSSDLHLTEITNAELFNIQTNDIHLIANEEAIIRVLPEKYKSKIKGKVSPLGTLDFKGDLFLNPSKIATNGTFISQLGQVQISEGMLANYSTTSPSYSGHIISKNLNVNPFVANSPLGNINTDIRIKGSGFDPNTMQVSATGDIYNIRYDKYNLNNIYVDATYQNQIIEGLLNSKDAKASMDAIGKVDFNQSQIKADVEGKIEHLDLYALGFLKDHTTVKGMFDVDITGSKLEDIVGDIDLKYIEYVSTDKAMPFESININTYFENNDRVLNILSPSNINGTIKGRFDLQDIPTMFINGLSNMVVGLKPKKNLKNKFLFIDLDIQDNVIDLIFPDLSLESGTRITGEYDGGSNDMKLLVNTPKLNYKNIIVDSLQMLINTDNPSQQFKVDLEALYMNELAIKKLSASGYMQSDTLKLSSDFNLNSLDNEKVILNLFQTKTENELVVGIQNSSIKINEILWQINPKKEVNKDLITYNMDTKVWYFNNFQLESDLSKVDAYGYFKDNEDFEFNANVKNVLLQNIVPSNQLGEFELKGLINAQAKIKQNGQTFQPIVDVHVEDLFFNDYSLGDFQSEIVLNDEDINKFDIAAFLEKNNAKYLTIKGDIENRKNDSPLLDLDLNFDQFEMNILNQFLSSIISDMRGTVTGDLSMEGELRNPTYKGQLVTQDVGMTIEYLQTDYQFEDDSFILLDGKFDKGSIDLLNIPFVDSKFGTKGNLFGSIKNSELKVWSLNLAFQSDDEEKGLMILDTTEEDNDLFYGRVFAKGEFYLSGSTNETISITSDATVLETSSFTLNNATTYTIDSNSILHFVKDESIIENENETPTRSTGVNLEFGIKVEDGAEITVLLDQITNSTITVRGYTDPEGEGIKFKMNPAGEIEMDGVYKVSSGKYFFKLGVLKEFYITDDSKIEWTGNPYDANLYIHTYNRVLVNNIGEYLNSQNQPATEVDLGIDLTGSLSNMDIDFTITSPKSSTDIQNLLQNKFFNNPDEVKIQFFFLLSSKSFNTEANQYLENTVTSNAYDLVLNQFFNMVNSINPNIQLNASYTPEDNNNNTSSSIQGTIDFRLNNRWNIRSTLGIPINTSSASNDAIWTQEVEMELDVSKDNDGSVVLEAFSRPTTFGLVNFTNNTSTYQSYGLGVILKWDFNEFNEIIKNKKEREKDSIRLYSQNDSMSIISREIDSLMKSKSLID